MRFHEDPVAREERIRDYLLRRLTPAAAEEFESHYLSCQECFEELEASQGLMSGLAQSRLDLRQMEGVVVLTFDSPAHLVRHSLELSQLRLKVLEQKDTKVLIDLSRVSRIDSAGLGALLTCYSHAVRHQGMLKLLNPSEPVQELLRLTRLDGVLEAYPDERAAIESFR